MATNLQQTLSNPKYRNWVKSGLVLKFTKDGIQHFVDKEVERFHKQILAKCGPAATNCTNCMTKNVPPTSNMTCQKGICDKFRNSITYSHRYRKKNSNHEGPSWRNTDAQQWCSNSWEVAKCYMAASGYSDASSAVDTDLPGLLSVIINLTDFDSAVTENLSVNTNIFCKARNIRNDVIHTSTFEVIDNELNGYIATMIQLLSDSKRLAADTNAIDAIAELIKIKNGTLNVTDVDERQLRTDALQAINDKKEEAIQAVETEGNKQREDVAKRGSEQVDRVEKTAEKVIAKLKQNDADKENAEEQKYIEQQKDLQKHLIRLYQTDYKKESLQPLNPDDTDTDISDIYVEPCMESVGTNGERSPVTSYKDIFYKDGRPCKMIYIAGLASMGKTTLCLKMIDTWCKVQSNPTNLSENEKAMLGFQFLFYISLRNALSNSKIGEMIRKQLVEKKCFETLISRMPGSETCLIILDGLDEWTPPAQHESIPAVNNGLPGRPSVTKWTIVTTTRPWKLEVLRLKQVEIDHQIEIKGMNKESSDKFIDNVISILNNKHRSNKYASKFKEEISGKHLGQVCTIPVILKQLICLWYDGKPLGKSQCDIYSSMIELLFELAVNSEKIPQGDQCTEKQKKLPKCFHDKTYCEQYKDLVMSLSRLAFKALFNDTGSYLVFESKKISSYGLSDIQMKNCMNVGILSQSKVSTELSSKTASLTFIHKTIQEFLAAVFVSMTSDSFNTISNICKSVDKVFEMSNVFVFVSGMCPETTYKLSELISDVSSTEKQEYRSRLYSNYKLVLVQEIIIGCIEEGRKNGHEGFKLKLQDIIIDQFTSYRLFSLMNLLHDNIQSHIYWDHVLSLSVTVSSKDESIKLSELLNHIDSPLQILIIKSELVKTSTDDIYNVLCKVKDSLCKFHLSIGHIKGNVKDRFDFSELSTEQLSTMMPDVKHITDLQLEFIILTSEQLRWLLDYISQATQLTHIVFEQCTTSDLVPFESSFENIYYKRFSVSRMFNRNEIYLFPHNKPTFSLDLSNHDKLKTVCIDPHLATVVNTKLDSLETFTMKLSPLDFKYVTRSARRLCLEGIKASSTQYSCLILMYSESENKLAFCECSMNDTPENIEIRLPDDIIKLKLELSIKRCFGDIRLISPTEMSNIRTIFLEDLDLTRPSILSSIFDMPSVSKLHLTIIKFCVEEHELPVMKNLQIVQMYKVCITGKGLQHFMSSSVPNLSKMVLIRLQFDYPVDESGEHVLPMLKNLQYVRMESVKIKGNSLKYLMSSAPNLKKMTLSCMHLEYHVAEHEMSLPKELNLEYLYMREVEITVEALHYFMSSIRHVEALHLNNVHLEYPEDEGEIRSLPRMRNIESVKMDSVEITGKALNRRVNNALNTQILGNRFSEKREVKDKKPMETLFTVTSMVQEITRLCLVMCSVELYRFMSSIPTIKSLEMRHGHLDYNVAEGEKQSLPLLPHLESLYMSEVSTTDMVLNCFIDKAPNIKTLRLEYMESSVDLYRFMSCIPIITTLGMRSLHLDYNVGEGEIHSLPLLPHLEYLYMSEVSTTDMVLNCFIDKAPNIKTLVLEHINIESTEGLQLLSDVKFLKFVTITWCTISSTGFRCFLDNVAQVPTPVVVMFENVTLTPKQKAHEVMDYIKSHRKYENSTYEYNRQFGRFSFYAELNQPRASVIQSGE